MDTKGRKRFDIISGPSRDAIFDNCKYSFNRDSVISIYFTIITGYTQPRTHHGCATVPSRVTDVKISRIEYEDGSGDKFNLRGHCRANLHFNDNAPDSLYKFDAYYDSKTRKGGIALYN